MDQRRRQLHQHCSFSEALRAEGVPCSDGYVPLYREGLFTRLSHRDGPWLQADPIPDYTSLNLPVCEQVCGDTLWLPQTLLLAERPDMEDIAVALNKIL